MSEKICAIYVRVSTDDQSLASQLPDLLKWAEDSGKPYRIWTDAFTGRRMDRPGFRELYDQILRDEIEALVVWRIDRLGRTASGLTKLFDDLREHGVNLISLRDGFDLSTPAGRLHAQIISSVAEYETEIRRERINAGLAAARLMHDEVRALAKQGRTVEQIMVEARVRPTKRRTAVQVVEAILKKEKGMYWGNGGKGRRRVPGTEHDRIRQLIAVNNLTPAQAARVLQCGVRSVWRRIADMGGLATVKASAGAEAGAATLAQVAATLETSP